MKSLCMFNLIIVSIKALLISLWILAFLGLLSISPLSIEYQSYILALTGIVLLVHLLEFFVMRAKVKSKSKIGMSFLQTMLWGFGYWLPLLKNK